jgi:hypothetical protein
MNRNRQAGITLIGAIIVGGFLAFAMLLAFRSVPAWTEYMAVVRVMTAVAEEGDNGATMAQLRRSFDVRGQIDDITTVSGKDLIIYKQGGKVVVEVEYARKVPIVGNASLLFDFKASSASKGV